MLEPMRIEHIIVGYDVKCDHCGRHLITPTVDRDEVIRAVEKRGWMVDTLDNGKRDVICPRHRKMQELRLRRLDSTTTR